MQVSSRKPDAEFIRDFPSQFESRRLEAARLVVPIALLSLLVFFIPALARAVQEDEAQEPREETLGERLSRLRVPGLESLTIQAESTRFEGTETVVFSGYVDIEDPQRDVRLQADRVRIRVDTYEFEAEGNVVFDQGDLRLTGSSMKGDLDDGTGEVQDVVGVMPGPAYITAETLIQLEPGKFEIVDGTVTPCRQATPIWDFRARRMSLEPGDHASMLLPNFRVKNLPVLALPYLYWPLDEDGRATGFLLPSIGTSNNKGFMFSETFFWAIDRSYDLSLTYERFSKAGNGYEAEFRHALDAGSRGSVRFYRLDGTRLTQEDIAQGAESVPGGWTLDAEHVQQLPHDFQLRADANFFTSTDFIRGFEDNFNRFLRRNSSLGAFLTRNWDVYTLNVVADQNRTFFGSDSSVTRRRLPEVEFRIRSAPFWGLFYLDLESSAARLERTQETGNEDSGGAYTRLDAFPTVSMPVTEIPWLTFNPFFRWRSTRYSHQDQRRDPELLAEPITQSFYETGVDVVGPSFFRIFETPTNDYSPRFKNVIEPRISWERRSVLETDGRVISFDEIDRVGRDSNRMVVSLTSRLLAKRFPSERATERSVWEVFSVEFSRTFDLQEDDLDDPFPSIPLPYSLTSRITPTQRINISTRVNFTPDFSLGSYNVSGTMNFERGSARVFWDRSARTFADPDDPSKVAVEGFNRVSGGGNIDLLNRSITIGGHASLDITSSELQEVMLSGQLNTQCCSIGGQWRRIDFTFRSENQISLIVELLNVGSLGFGSERR